jgi:hypothetical protein
MSKSFSNGFWNPFSSCNKNQATQKKICSGMYAQTCI